MLRSLRRAGILAATIAPVLGAQQVKDTTKAVPLAAITTTATRIPLSTFDTPQPNTLIDSTTLREKLTNNIADAFRDVAGLDANGVGPNRSEEHTSELQSPYVISYAVLCLKKTKLRLIHGYHHTLPVDLLLPHHAAMR